jgi:hypothetical protein
MLNAGALVICGELLHHDFYLQVPERRTSKVHQSNAFCNTHSYRFMILSALLNAFF